MSIRVGFPSGDIVASIAGEADFAAVAAFFISDRPCTNVCMRNENAVAFN
jgi:hypothetical protein